MDAETVWEVSRKLLGNIIPVGSEHIDGDRYFNLKKTICFIDMLFDNLIEISDLSNRPEASVKRSADEVFRYLEIARDKIEDKIEERGLKHQPTKQSAVTGSTEPSTQICDK